jgi:mannose-binding lectin 1
MQGGFIRGFLNDGSTDFKSHHSVDSLAFGHCEYSYRNLGRPSRIQMQQTDEKFRVQVDGILCFESTKVKLPLHNFFGITAASAENPDSFEVFKFVTTTDKHEPDWEDPWQEIRNNAAAKAAEMVGRAADPPHKDQQTSKNDQGDIPAFSDPPDTPADKYTSSAEQFADLHNRLQAMTKHINSMGRETSLLVDHARTRHDYIVEHMAKLETQISQLRTLHDMMEVIQRDVRQTKEDVHNALDSHVSSLRSQLTHSHTSLEETVKLGHGWGKFFLIVVGSQAVTVGVYLLYKRRKANSPKKYL